MPHPPAPSAPAWTVVLPLKGGVGAKSRLRTAPLLRPRYAAAMAADCLAAVLACPLAGEVVVVSADDTVLGPAAAAGAHPVRDPGDGLLPAVRAGLQAAAPASPVAVLLGDLPALRPEDVTAALTACGDAVGAPGGQGSAFVPDAEGTGTVLLAAASARAARPAFGPGSAIAHEALGAVRLALDLPRLRRDVDTVADLVHAAALGVGPATAALLAVANPWAAWSGGDGVPLGVLLDDAATGA